MELRYPILFIILIIIVTILLFFPKKKKTSKYTIGTKIANTSFIKDTPYFKEKLKKYMLIKKLLMASFIIALFTSVLMIARICKIDTINEDEYNRDIFLCMDVSTSVDELNVELVENLKDTVRSLKGERFGISIFNTSSVTLVPLTDDYEYVITVLDKIKNAITTYNAHTSSGLDLPDNYYSTTSYIMSGTLVGNDKKGSSLIGDGLATAVYSFSNLEEERSRIIIFSTDNDLAGTPLVSLSKAADISKEKEIKVFGIGTTLMDERDKQEMKSAVEKTGGKFYLHSKNSIKSVVNDIEKTSKSLLKDNKKTQKIDIPQVPFIILTISILLILILSKKVTK